MDFFAALFLESPLRLAAFSFALFAAALFARRRMEGRAREYCMPGTLALIALLSAIQSVVVTRREEVRAALDAFIAAIEREDATAIAVAISPDYQGEDMRREDILAYIHSSLGRMKIYDTRLNDVNVRIEDRRAEVSFLARATVAVESAVGEPHWGRWQIGFQYEGDSWSIAAIHPIMLDGVQISRLRELRP